MDFEQRLNEARALHRRGELDRAESLYEEILAAHPDHVEARHLLGVLALQRKDLRRAVELLEACTKQQPGEARYRNNLGNAYMLARRHADAVAAFAAAVAADPDFLDPRYNHGVALTATGQNGAAERRFREVIARQSNHAGALANLGALLCALERFDEAIEALQRARVASPEDPRIRYNLAQALAGDGDGEAALAELEALIADRPDFTLAQRLRARLAKPPA